MMTAKPRSRSHERSGFVYDPLHGHSFERIDRGAGLSALQRSTLCFRDCLACHERVLRVLPTSHKRRLPSATSPAVPPPAATTDLLTASTKGDNVCQCLSCGAYVHRECLSYVHLHRHCRDHAPLIATCEKRGAGGVDSANSSPPARAIWKLLSPGSTTIQTRLQAEASTFTISGLIEALSPELQAGHAEAGSPRRRTRADSNVGSPEKSKHLVAGYMRRYGPLVAAGGVLGAIAMGPVGSALAGLNVLISSTIGVEAVMAGLGLTATATAAAAATVSHKKKVKRQEEEERRSAQWATKICWDCKQAFRSSGTSTSDNLYRRDVAFLRRFQLALEGQQDQLPTFEEVNAFLFGVYATNDSLISHINSQLCQAFRQRHSTRYSGQTSTAAARASLQRDTLHDAKVYIAHALGATMQCFPSFASTDQAMLLCSKAVERIVFDDINSIVLNELEQAFGDVDALFHANIDRLRAEQDERHYQGMMFPPAVSPTLKHRDLVAAEAKLVEMIEQTRSPLLKLDLLCDAFRSICCFADQLHQTAANADILIPLLCAVLISSTTLAPRVWKQRAAFVSEIAFITFFTNGGGKGVEGYVLTTFQAAIQVIAAIDLSDSATKELDLFSSGVLNQSGGTEDDTDDDDEFFDTVTV